MFRRIVLFPALGAACTATDHHTPELGIQTLQCITLTPSDGKPRVSDRTTQLIVIPGSKAELNSDGEPGRDTLTLVVYLRSVPQ